jgi:flagellin-like hook-associated protein FlgL
MSSGLGAIDRKVINILANYSSSQSSGTTKGSASDNAIKTSLRTGAQTYSYAVRGLNTLASYINVARATMQKLEGVVDEMATLVNEAKKSTTGSSARDNLQIKYEELVKTFRATIEQARVGDQDLLTTDGLDGVFKNFGLDKDQSDSISNLFTLFETPDTDTALASEEVKGPRPVSIPDSAFTTPRSVSRRSTSFEEIFDEERRINNRPEAYRMAVDLQALKDQIEKNVKALNTASEVVISNLKLAQGAGFAFLDAYNEGSYDSAEKAAAAVREKIRQNAPGALAQAENLKPILVAALALGQAGAFDE